MKRLVCLPCRDEENLSSLVSGRALALELILKRAFDKVDDLLARVAMPRGGDT